MDAFLIGFLGQAYSSSLLEIVVAHPGHAFPGGRFDAFAALLLARVGMAVESLALGRASRCAAAKLGFFHEPYPVRATSFRLGLGWVRSSIFAGRNSV